MWTFLWGVWNFNLQLIIEDTKIIWQRSLSSTQHCIPVWIKHDVFIWELCWTSTWFLNISLFHNALVCSSFPMVFLLAGSGSRAAAPVNAFQLCTERTGSRIAEGRGQRFYENTASGSRHLEQSIRTCWRCKAGQRRGNTSVINLLSVPTTSQEDKLGFILIACIFKGLVSAVLWFC